MYDIINRIISHTWNTDFSNTPQQIIYYICGVLIIVFCVVILDWFYRLFFNFFRGKKY